MNAFFCVKTKQPKYSNLYIYTQVEFFIHSTSTHNRIHFSFIRCIWAWDIAQFIPLAKRELEIGIIPFLPFRFFSSVFPIQFAVEIG